MTTIAYDGLSLAADKLETFGHNERCPHPVQKIMRCSIPKRLGKLPPPLPGETPVERHHLPRQRVLVALAGSLVEARLVLLHYIEATRVLGQPASLPPENIGSLIVVHLDEEQRDLAVIVGSRGGITTTTGTPMVTGSGGDFALGAMYAGKGAHQAVEIAAKLDPYTGSDVQSVLIAAAKAEPIENFPYYLD